MPPLKRKRPDQKICQTSCTSPRFFLPKILIYPACTDQFLFTQGARCPQSRVGRFKTARPQADRPAAPPRFRWRRTPCCGYRGLTPGRSPQDCSAFPRTGAHPCQMICLSLRLINAYTSQSHAQGARTPLPPAYNLRCDHCGGGVCFWSYRRAPGAVAGTGGLCCGRRIAW